MNDIRSTEIIRFPRERTTAKKRVRNVAIDILIKLEQACECARRATDASTVIENAYLRMLWLRDDMLDILREHDGPGEGHGLAAGRLLERPSTPPPP